MANKKEHKVTLNYSYGSNGGTAIYLQRIDPDGGGVGFRVAGLKCWGFIKDKESFDLDVDDLNAMIREAKAAIKHLARAASRRKGKAK